MNLECSDCSGFQNLKGQDLGGFAKTSFYKISAQDSLFIDLLTADIQKENDIHCQALK
jgi:hypothetical protein